VLKRLIPDVVHPQVQPAVVRVHLCRPYVIWAKHVVASNKARLEQQHGSLQIRGLVLAYQEMRYYAIKCRMQWVEGPPVVVQGPQRLAEVLVGLMRKDIP